MKCRYRYGILGLSTVSLTVIFFKVLAASAGCTALMTDNSASDRADITVLEEKAQASLGKKEYDEALKYLLEAYNLSVGRQDSLAAAALNNKIGGLYEQVGRFQEALMSYEQGLTALTSRQAGAAADVGQALEELRGSEKAYSLAQGEPVSADLYRGEISSFAQAMKQSPDTLERELSIILLMNAGNMYLQQNQYDPADIDYRKALELTRTSKLRLRTRQIYANMAWATIRQQKFDEADVLLSAALEQTSEETPPVELRRALLALGVNAREKGDYEKAVGEMERAVSLYDYAGDLRGKGHALAHLGTAHYKKDEYKKAKGYYLQAIGLSRELDDAAMAWHASGGLGKTFYRLGDLDAALKHYEQYMRYLDKYNVSYFTDQGRVAILEDHGAVTDEYVNAAVEQAQKVGDFASARKAIERSRARALKSLLEAKEVRLRKKPGTLEAGPFLYGERWPYFQLEYASYIKVESATGAPSEMILQMAPAPGAPDFPGLNEEGQPEPKVWSDQPLPAVTFLETFVLPGKTIILVRQDDGTVSGSVVNVTQQHLTGLIERYRMALAVYQPRGVTLVSSAAAATGLSGISQNQDEAKIAQELYRLLIEPVRKLLPADPEKNVVIVPHKALWYLPFTALRDGQGMFFGDRHVLTYAVSEATWEVLATRARSAGHRNIRAWVAGNPGMPATIEKCGVTMAMDRLPGAGEEAEEIARLLGTKRAELFTGLQADRLRLDAWHSAFSVLHLATHGVACSEDPLSSFLVLKSSASEELSLDEEKEMVSVLTDGRYPVSIPGAQRFLKDSPLPAVRELSYPGLLDARSIIGEYDLDADLVTLSACQTGLGRLTGEGLIGFTRAFLSAGARSLLVSLWRVDDRSTKELMVNFYRQYLQHGNKGLALQHAMAETRKHYPEPKFWAGFTLVGLAE